MNRPLYGGWRSWPAFLCSIGAGIVASVFVIPDLHQGMILPYIIWGVWLSHLAIILMARRPKRYGQGLCEACGYNLTANTSGVCPECGTPVLRKPEAVV